MKYFPTIGLEIHAEIRTKSKMFCDCINNPDEDKVNSNICAVCLGHPGTLPVLNHEAIRQVLRVGTAVKGHIADFTEWDRKNYFYPDIPKGYQISQYKYPLISGGELAHVSIERIHLEEDTAQSTHDTHKRSLINFNRSGVPLMELVTKPVIHDAITAVNFAKELQLLLRFLNASGANLEKGEMRIEANISVSKDKDTLGTKTEVKNLNSFRVVEKAINFEIARQTSLLEEGKTVLQETRGWDEKKEETFSQRSKESSHDYRYFPEPDLPKMKISLIPQFGDKIIRESLPELPWEMHKRYMDDYHMTNKEINFFLDFPLLRQYFEKVIKPFKGDQNKIKLATNYLLSDYVGLLKKETNDWDQILNKISPQNFSELIDLIALDKVSSRGAKELIPIMITEPNVKTLDLCTKHNLLQSSSTSELEPIIDKIILDNMKVVNEYKGGKTASLQFLIGQVMKITKGSANPKIISEILQKKLNK